MNINIAINNIKQVFTDSYFANLEGNTKEYLKLNDRYFTLREFVMNCDILSFTELEQLEMECINRINKLI